MLLLQTTRLFLACLQKVSCYLYLIIGQLSAVCMFHWDVYIYLIAIISTCNQGLHNLQYFCRSRPTFWYATARWLSDSTFSVSIQYRWWTPPLIYPISTSTRYDSVCSYSLLHCSVVSFKTNSHFFFLAYLHNNISMWGQFYFLFTSDHLSIHVPCSNYWRAEWVRKVRLAIQNSSYQTYYNFSSGFAPHSGMLHASGCWIPPPQHFDSGYQPLFMPSQQGITHLWSSGCCFYAMSSYRTWTTIICLAIVQVGSVAPTQMCTLLLQVCDKVTYYFQTFCS